MGGRVRAALALVLALGPAWVAPEVRAEDGVGERLDAALGERLEAPLGERLDAALRHRGLRGARIAALVVDREDGSVLYARDPDRALVPASNQKVLTAIAALSHFGPAHRFTTEVLAAAPPDAEGAVAGSGVGGTFTALGRTTTFSFPKWCARMSVNRPPNATTYFACFRI